MSIHDDFSMEVVGTFNLDFGGGSTLLLHDVLHISRMQHSLLLMSKLLLLSLGVEFHQNNVLLNLV